MAVAVKFAYIKSAAVVDSGWSLKLERRVQQQVYKPKFAHTIHCRCTEIFSKVLCFVDSFSPNNRFRTTRSYAFSVCRFSPGSSSLFPGPFPPFIIARFLGSTCQIFFLKQRTTRGLLINNSICWWENEKKSQTLARQWESNEEKPVPPLNPPRVIRFS